MDNFDYAMTSAFENMKDDINHILNISEYTKYEKDKLFLSVGSCLHWILDYAERVDIKDRDKGIISAFRYANNSLKHSIEVKELTKDIGGFEFPFEFPLEIPEREVVWAIIDNGNKENQRLNYKKYLEGKNVIDTCETVIKILKGCEKKK